MVNLKSETIEQLKDNGKTPDDVRWVGGATAKYENPTSLRMTWDTFAKHADFDYDTGYGGEQVNLNLLVVGDDWWLERHEYDGSEWWEFQSLPIAPEIVTDDPPSDLVHNERWQRPNPAAARYGPAPRSSRPLC